MDSPGQEGTTAAIEEPKQGLVNQVRREWLVHEDSALAYRLQEKEIEMHYGKNREERKIIRMDLKQAKSLQESDDQDSTATIGTYVDDVFLQELEDERVAKELQEQIEREEALHNRILEQADKELARKLQENESRHVKRKTKRGETSDPSRGAHNIGSGSKKDLASCYEDTLTRATRNMSLDGAVAGRTSGGSSPISRISDTIDTDSQLEGPPSTPILDQQELRRYQEIKDEELALTMQEEEVTKTSQYYKDQQLAIEAQDRELAKLLQEKERLRAKRAKQKARSESQKSKGTETSDDGSKYEGPISDRNEYDRHTPRRGNSYFNPQAATKIGSDGTTINKASGSTRNRPVLSTRSQSCDAGLKRHDPPSQRSPFYPVSDDVPNIAMTLDPTYNQDLETIHRKSLDFAGASTSTSQSELHTRSLPIQAELSDDEYGSDEHVVPPYMPIQGQKRQVIDKRRKKDNCRQQ